MQKKLTALLLSFIVFIAIVLRFYQLGNVPPSPDWDEAALGYNAYSILLTGRDEYGKFLPFILRSFDDYKPALYTYFIIPFIPFLDISLPAVRLPSVLFGVGAVFATFFLIQELLKIGKQSSSTITSVSLVGAFLLAISPWHVQFSRIGFEASVAMAINIFALLCFLVGLRRPMYLVVAAFLFAINLYEYQSIRVFGPLLVLSIGIIFRKDILHIPKKYLFLSFFVGVFVALPMVFYTFTNKEGLARARGTSIFSDTTPFLKEDAARLIEDKKNNDYIGLLLDNRRIVYAKSIISGYLSHFDLNWLFITGDLSRHHAPFMGLLYLWELPFLLFGIYQLFFADYAKKTKFLVFLWFFISPIPASITSGVPHAIRTINFLPTFQIFSAIGIVYIFQNISHVKYRVFNIPVKFFFYSLFFILFTLNLFYYFNQYFVQQNYFYSKEWQYGYKDAVATIAQIEPKYKKIIVSNKPHLDQSYMFFLFYLKYPPTLYQKESLESSGGFRENHIFGKYEFRPIEWNKENKNKHTLYVGRPEDFPKDVNVIKTIYFLNSEPAIKIVQAL